MQILKKSLLAAMLMSIGSQINCAAAAIADQKDEGSHRSISVEIKEAQEYLGNGIGLDKFNNVINIIGIESIACICKSDNPYYGKQIWLQMKVGKIFIFTMSGSVAQNAVSDAEESKEKLAAVRKYLDIQGNFTL